MVRRSWLRAGALGVIAASNVVMVVGYAAAATSRGVSPWLATLVAVAVALQIAAWCVLGARRRDGRAGSAWVGAAAIVVLVGGALGYAILAPGADGVEPLVGGVPRRAAYVIYGIGVLPLVVLAAVFGRGFAAWAPTEADVARLRELRDSRGDAS